MLFYSIGGEREEGRKKILCFINVSNIGKKINVALFVLQVFLTLLENTRICDFLQENY